MLLTGVVSVRIVGNQLIIYSFTVLMHIVYGHLCLACLVFLGYA